MRKPSSVKRVAITLATISFLSFVSCQKSSSNGNGLGFDSGDGAFNLNDDYKGDFASDVNIGSGLTDADKQAINNVDKETQQVAPTEDWQIPADMQAQIQQLLTNGKQCDNGSTEACNNVQVLKMQVAGQILKKCMETVIPLVPKPGQPLLGSWSGGGGCPVRFDVSGTGENGAYVVGSGGDGQTGQTTNTSTAKYSKKDNKKANVSTVNGTMQAAADGSGMVKSNTFSGKLTDQPSSGQGSLTNPTAKKTKYGHDPCTVAVSLQESTNPIPRNYEEGMKRAGVCHRKALLLMSPIFDNLFKGLNPEMAQMILGQSLGVKK